MQSTFINYGLSYFDILLDKINSLIGNLTSGRLLGSLNGQAVETRLTYATTRALITTDETLLSIGEKSGAYGSENLGRIDIGFWNNGDIGYPNTRVDIFPHTRFYYGANFEKTPVNYHPGAASLWANNSGNLILEDKEVCSGSGVSGNIALFDTRPGTLQDSGIKIASGVFQRTLRSNAVLPGFTLIAFFSYTIIGDVATLTVQRKMFKGIDFASPGSFLSDGPDNFLPAYIRPAEFVAFPILTFRQIGVANETNLVEPPGLCTIDITGEIIIYQNIDNNPQWDASAGNNDGWPSFSISYAL